MAWHRYNGGLAAHWVGQPKEQHLLLESRASHGKEIPPQGEVRHTASLRPPVMSHLSKHRLNCNQEIPASPKFTSAKAKGLWMGGKRENQGSVCL